MFSRKWRKFGGKPCFCCVFVQLLRVPEAHLCQSCLILEAPCVSLGVHFHFTLLAPRQEKWWAYSSDLHSEWKLICLTILAYRTYTSVAQQEWNFSPFSTNTDKRKDLNLKTAGNFRPACRSQCNSRFLPPVYACTEWFCRTQHCFSLMVFRSYIFLDFNLKFLFFIRLWLRSHFILIDRCI